MALTVGELVAYLRTDDSKWNTKAARSDLQDFQRDANGRLRDINGRFVSEGNAAGKGFSAGIGGGVSKAAASLVKLTGSLAGVQGAVAAIGGVVGVAQAAAGALGLLPAVGVAVGAGMVAAKLGVQGFSDAVSASDPAEFTEALKTLSPAARETAIAVRDLRDEWEVMQNNVQEQLFTSLARHVQALGTLYIPVLGKGLGDIAAQFNYATQTVASFLARSETVRDVAATFANVRQAIGNVSDTAQPLAQIFGDLVTVGSEFLPILTRGFGVAARGAAEFVRTARESGALSEWMETGIATLRELGAVFGNVGDIAVTVFKALNNAGAGVLPLLVNLTGQVEAFLKSAQGQEILHSLAATLRMVADTVGQVLLIAFREVVPVIASELVPAVIRLLQAILPLVPPIAQLAAQLLTGLIPAVAQLIEAATPVIVMLIQITTTILSAVVPVVVFLGNVISALASIILNIYGAALRFFVETTRAGWTQAKDIFRSGVDTVRGIVRWFEGLGGMFRNWFGGMVQAIGDAIGNAIRWVYNLRDRIFGAVGDFGSLLYNAGRDLIQGLINGISAMVGRLVAQAREAASRAMAEIASALGLGSPSRITRQYGQWLGEGLALGMADAGTLVARAADQLSATALADVPAPALAGAETSSVGGFGGASPLTAGAGQGITVNIGTYNPPANATAYEVASDLAWFARGGG